MYAFLMWNESILLLTLESTMPSALNEVLSKAKCTIDAVIEAINTENIAEARMNQKSAKKFLSLLKAEADLPNGIPKVSDILSSVSKNMLMVNQLVNSGPILSSILDKLLSTAISSRKGDIYDQKSLTIIFDLINQSDKLKSQLCMSIHEYILTAIEQGSLQQPIISKSMELLVSAVTHHQENRTFFIKNTSKGKIAAVFNLTKNTGNPMVQIFSIEFLWRVAIPMRLSIDEKEAIFGQYSQMLYSIGADSFREGILNFVEELNKDRRDPQQILQMKIKNLMIGNNPTTGTHNIYFGSDSILLWVTKNTKFAKYHADVELVTLKRNDVSGIGILNNTWCIGITSEFDTLTDFFEQTERLVTFQPINENKSLFNIVVQRFGKINVPKIPTARPFIAEKIRQTPCIQVRNGSDQQQCVKRKAATPKTPMVKEKNETPKPKKESSQKQKKSVQQPKTPVKQKETPRVKKTPINSSTPKNKPNPKVVSLSSDDEIETISESDKYTSESDSLSSSEEEKETKLETRHSPRLDERKTAKQELKTTAVKKEKVKIHKPKVTPHPKGEKSIKKEIEKSEDNKSLQTKKLHTKHKPESPPPPPKEESDSSDYEIPIEDEAKQPMKKEVDKKLKKNQKKKREIIEIEKEGVEIENLDDDDIPPVQIQSSFQYDFNLSSSSDDSSFDLSQPKANDDSDDFPNVSFESQDRNKKGQEIIIDNPLKSTIHQEKIKAPPKMRQYTPERWELDTFDELKNFGNAIRSRLSERQMMLNRAIEDAVNNSLKDATDFLEKCDADLDQLRTDFASLSSQISGDIEQKQKMVIQLGDQQSEHITQIIKDCERLRKRAQEQKVRFSHQKEALKANQAKHIALFNDDMKSEFKAAITTKKRESTKRRVQELASLIDLL
ncbi:hypothetical protein TRFO_02696 [Tritrichomonas foetus]|uniref:Uncharacterized protein n=1 Tax=Tritrichomonas foetus TaxID=1144522 RepID=A0A1J4L3E8_9EUKA|nr:hypothetical protein TRFO_02696 [Tritrichomonas foetus]|eukprot:OHT16437.1 hypothetical protein TRFO_02696 [Tritrichomonas foetus]